MKNQHDQPRSSGWGALAVLVSVLLLTAAGAAMVYRLSSGGARAKANLRSTPEVESVYVSTKPPRVVQTAESATVPAATPAGARDEAPPAEPGAEEGGLAQPFVDARSERRDSVWALQMESSVRDALTALTDKKITFANVQCASIRCTLEGSVGPGGRVQDIVTAVNGVGLTQGRFKRTRNADGTMTFSAVMARQGYKIDGSPKEPAPKTL